MEPLEIKSDRWVDSVTSLRQNVHRSRLCIDGASRNCRCAEGCLIVDVHDATNDEPVVRLNFFSIHLFSSNNERMSSWPTSFAFPELLTVLNVTVRFCRRKNWYGTTTRSSQKIVVLITSPQAVIFCAAPNAKNAKNTKLNTSFMFRFGVRNVSNKTNLISGIDVMIYMELAIHRNR